MIERDSTGGWNLFFYSPPATFHSKFFFVDPCVPLQWLGSVLLLNKIICFTRCCSCWRMAASEKQRLSGIRYSSQGAGESTKSVAVMSVIWDMMLPWRSWGSDCWALHFQALFNRWDLVALPFQPGCSNCFFFNKFHYHQCGFYPATKE